MESDIAERLGVSRIPAREAMSRLYHEGFLVATETTRRLELAVAPLTRDDLLDLYRVMSALEGSAARGVSKLNAAERNDLAVELTDREVRFEKAAKTRKIDYDLVFERHNAFHELLVDAGAGPRHRSLLETVRPQVDRYEWMYAPLVGPDYTATFVEHAAIIRAVRSGSADNIERAVASNWDRGGDRLAAVIGRAGSRGDWLSLT